MKFFIYLAAIYGNEQEGPDGLDTLFLVRASGYQEAATLVDARYSSVRQTNWVCTVGIDCSTGCESRIILGPFLGMAGIGEDYPEIWIRETGEGVWRPISDYR